MNADVDPSELSDLITRVQAGDASPAQQQRLIDLLTASAQARRQYVDHVIVSVLLSETAGDLFDRLGSGASVRSPGGAQTAGASLHDAMILPALVDEQGSSAKRNPDLIEPRLGAGRTSTAIKFWRRPRWMGLAAALLVALFVAGMLKRPRGSATLVGAIDAKWADATPALPEGMSLPPAELELAGGLVRIQFSSGATAVIQGPARFRAEPPNRLNLLSGKISVVVPERARGFTVTTASATVIDLGTEFGVKASPGGDTDLMVFRGSVSVVPKAGSLSPAPAAVVTAGLAERVSVAGTVSAVAPNPSTFVLGRDFESAWAAGGSEAFKRWRVYSERLGRDSSLIAYYTFDNEAQAPDRLLNRSLAGHSLDGILGDGDPAARPQWGAGRFPEKGALRFHASTSQRVGIPASPTLDFSRGNGAAKPFTLCAWAKASRQQLEAAGIICRGGWFAEQYAIDAHPGPGGYRAWVRRRSGGRGNEIELPEQPEETWHYIVSVYDPTEKTLSLFIDGRRYGVTAAPQALLEATGQVDLGARRGPGEKNWKTFNGCIDEVAIFGRALSAAEVREAYDAGRPDPMAR